MAGSIGQAYRVLGGYQIGNVKSAESFLNNMTPGQFLVRNRAESRVRGRLRSRPLRLGQRPRRRKAV